MGFEDAEGGSKRERMLKFGNHQSEVLPTHCFGGYLESLEFKHRRFTQVSKGENYNQF